jgi:hypothetical protein
MSSSSGPHLQLTAAERCGAGEFCFNTNFLFPDIFFHCLSPHLSIWTLLRAVTTASLLLALVPKSLKS